MVREAKPDPTVPPGQPVRLDAAVVDGHAALILNDVPLMLPAVTAQQLGEKLLATVGLVGPPTFSIGKSEGPELTILIGALVIKVEQAAAQHFAESVFAELGRLTGKTYMLLAAGQAWDSKSGKWRRAVEGPPDTRPGETPT